VSHVLHLGDGIAGMAAMPDRSVDVVCTDPPYSEHTHAKVRRGGSFHAPDVTTPQFTGDRPGIGCEAITVAHRRGRKRWNGGGKRGIYRVAIESGERIHTTQKPLELIEALVRDFTDPGELILDPFAGSGTLHVAAKRPGRNALGWELNEAWHAAAVRRIDAAREQFQLPTFPRPRQLQLEGPDKDDAA
jgi:DNA modification methylase